MKQRDGRYTNFVVIEGTDGSGKNTQTTLLEEYLHQQNIRVKRTGFPRYDLFYGKMIRDYLNGVYGDPKAIPPQIIGAIYAADRHNTSQDLSKWLDEGTIVIADRYTGSMAHQVGRLPRNEWDTFIEWYQMMEYEVNEIPKEGTVIFLHVPTETTKELMQNADRKHRAHAGKDGRDLVEKDTNYLEGAEAAFLYLTEKYDHWTRINCAPKGTMRTREDIQEEIRTILKARNVLP